MPDLEYQRVGWQNAPDKSTPLSAANLTVMENGIVRNMNAINRLRSHVGSIIMSTRLDTMEKVIAIYGGEQWVQIRGKFLLGESDDYPISSEGGSAKGVLLRHRHEYEDWYPDDGSGDAATTLKYTPGTSELKVVTKPTLIARRKHNTAPPEESYTSNPTNKNLPPYKAVYIWERIV